MPTICLPGKSRVSQSPKFNSLFASSHRVLLKDAFDPISQLSLEEAEDELHRRPDILELALFRLLGEVVGRASSEEGLEHHVVGERD